MTAGQAIPSRWRPPGKGLIPVPRIAWRILGVRVKKDDPRVFALQRALLEADPKADALALWMQAEGEGRRLFERALEHGIEAVPNPAEPLAAFFADVDEAPAWLDRRKVALGAETLLRVGRGGYYALGGASLMSGYLSLGAVKPLVATGALTRMARRRIAETGKLLRDLGVSGPLDRFSEGWKTSVRVRVLHAMVRAELARSPRWRTADWGVPINQRDMVGTHLEFTVVFLLGIMALGYLVSREEREAVMHLWRYVSRLLGIPERLLPASFHEGLELAWIFNATETGPDEDGRALAAALVNAFTTEGDSDAAVLSRMEGRFLCGYSRFVLGPRAANALGLPNDAWKWAPLVAAPARASVEFVQRLIPGGRALAVRRGRDDVERRLSRALEGRPPEFQPHHA